MKKQFFIIALLFISIGGFWSYSQGGADGSQQKSSGSSAVESECCQKWKDGRSLKGCTTEEIYVCRQRWIEEQLRKKPSPSRHTPSPSPKPLHLKKAILVSW